MTTLTSRLTADFAAAPLPRAGSIASRFAAWLTALDASYRSAHTLAHGTDARLADMGITRDAAEAHFARHAGTIDRPSTQCW